MARQEIQYDNVPAWNKKGAISKGDKIEGFYVEKQKKSTKFGDLDIYILETNEGEKVALLGQSNIKNKFDKIELNTYVWVEFTGLVETENGARKEYKVENDPELVKA